MNNVYLTIISTIVRVFVVWFLGALASHLSPAVYTIVNDAITKLGGQEMLITSVAGFLAMLGLAIWLKLKSKLDLKIALELPKGATVADVKNFSDNKSALSVLKDPPK